MPQHRPAAPDYAALIGRTAAAAPRPRDCNAGAGDAV